MDGSGSRGERAARAYNHFGLLAAIAVLLATIVATSPGAENEYKHQSDKNHTLVICANTFYCQ